LKPSCNIRDTGSGQCLTRAEIRHPRGDKLDIFNEAASGEDSALPPSTFEQRERELTMSDITLDSSAFYARAKRIFDEWNVSNSFLIWYRLRYYAH
jgi:hypothetical protein